MVYLAAKGDGNIRFFEYVSETTEMMFLDQYNTTAPQKGVGFIPKLACDVGKKEVARAVKLESTKLNYISFIAPRKYFFRLSAAAAVVSSCFSDEKCCVALAIFGLWEFIR